MSENRYFIVSTSHTLQAVICLNEDEGMKTLDCTNYEVCYYSNALVNGKCPQYCEIMVEAKKYVFKRRKPKASVREIEEYELGRFVSVDRLPHINRH